MFIQAPSSAQPLFVWGSGLDPHSFYADPEPPV
jgi:hypothetical protein